MLCSLVLMEVTDNFVGEQRGAAACCCCVPSQQLSSASSYLEVLSSYGLSRGAKARESTLFCRLFMIGFNGSRVWPRPSCTYLGGSNQQCLEEMAALKLKELIEIKRCGNLFYTQVYGLSTGQAVAVILIQLPAHDSYINVFNLWQIKTTAGSKWTDFQHGQQSIPSEPRETPRWT